MARSARSTTTPEGALIEAYAAGDITLMDLMDRLCEVATPARSDPTGGDGYIRGTRDAIERAVGKGLLTEADWNAIVDRAVTCPALLAIE
jgi:hypothetical protein